MHKKMNGKLPACTACALTKALTGTNYHVPEQCEVLSPLNTSAAVNHFQDMYDSIKRGRRAADAARKELAEQYIPSAVIVETLDDSDDNEDLRRMLDKSRKTDRMDGT